MTKGRILAVCWLTYAGFYLLRVNFSVAIPGIIGEFGISKTVIGAVMSALFGVYAIGQFVNGWLGDRFSAKKLVALGLFTSAVLNIAFGFSGYIGSLTTMLAFMIFIWSVNGYFQSMGWAPTVKTITCWFPSNERGKASGILGSSYQLGGSFSWLLAGLVIGLWGWRWVFWAPAIIVILLVINWLIFAKDKPASQAQSEAVKTVGLSRETLKDRNVWWAALALFGLNIVRYGFLSWAPTYFFEVQKAAVSMSAYKAVIFPTAGSLGALSAGWMSDKFFKGKRCLMSIFMMLILIASIWAFPHIPQGQWVWALILLAVIGFTTYGPHVILVTTLPMDLGGKKRASSVAGFIDGWGYIGAAFNDITSGYLLQHYGWTSASYLWIAGAVFTTVMLVFLARMKPSAYAQEEIEPSR